MKNFAFLKFIALFVASAFVLSSCTWFDKAPVAEEDFDAFLKSGIDNLSDVMSAEYSFLVGGEIEVDDEVLSNAGFSTLFLNLSFDGALDFRDEDDVLFSMNSAFDINLDDELDENVSAEVRIVKDTLYIVLRDLSDFGGELPMEMVTPFLGQWWSLEMPPESTESLEKFAKSDDEEEMTPEQKQLVALFDETNFFPDVTYLGTERVGRENCYKYFAALDIEATLQYMSKANEIEEGTFTQEDIDEIREYVDRVEIEGNFWIGVNDETLRKFEGTVAFEDVEGVSGVLTLAFELSNLNGNVSVEEPAEAEDLEQMLMMLL